MNANKARENVKKAKGEQEAKALVEKKTRKQAMLQQH